VRTIEWVDEGVRIIDQTKLPGELVTITCKDHERLARAIEIMEIRGAPAIGIAAAMGIALAAKNSKGKTVGEIVGDLKSACERIRTTRPTARNLFWALERMKGVWEGASSVEPLREAVIRMAVGMAEDDVRVCRAIGKNGAELIDSGDAVLTHCNAGALACVEHGTALGVIRSTIEAGKRVFVYCTETRPLLQGARLTAFELKTDGIPFKLITDSMVAHVMQKGLVKKVVVGADRVTRQGDVVNKVGTCGIAILAKEFKIPFYAAAPLSTIDLSIEAEDIAIEERPPEEVTQIRGVRIAPDGVDVINPSFDMTPHEYVSGIITEKGVARAPYDLSFFFR
jgi:methylthioribose-1-phosphate isomerase